MSRSVPRNLDHKGEFLSRCDVCGIPYLRSQLRRRRDGLLHCPKDYPGRDAMTLAELTAARAATLAGRLGQQALQDGAFPDLGENGENISASQYTGPVTKRTAEDVYQENGGPPTYASSGTKVGLPGF